MSTPGLPRASLGQRIARARKAIATALGFAVTLILLVPEDTIPETWRPYIGIVLAAATVFGVYNVRNAPAPKPTLPKED